MITPGTDLDVVFSVEPADYDEVLAWQDQARKSLLDGTGPEALWLGEHRSVITLGRNTDESHLLVPEADLERTGTQVRRIDRGGDVTWHGPGQLVGYPILDLSRHREDLHWYLRSLETTLIRVLASYGLEAFVIDGKTGVWVRDALGEAKIASIGIHCSRWITKHGFSLNVSPDLSAFQAINACGLNCRQTSLSALLGPGTPGFDRVRKDVVREFTALFSPTAVCHES